MTPATGHREQFFDCYACGYAQPLAAPFEEWVWCNHPAGARPLNLAHNSECRRPGGGRAPDSAHRDASVNEPAFLSGG